MMKRTRYTLLMLCLFIFFLHGNQVAFAKDQCCHVVNQNQCYHWDTFATWAGTKCAALGLAAGSPSQTHTGNCSDNHNCSASNTIHSKKTSGVVKTCKEDIDCAGSTRCAKLALKKNECVVPCSADSDCPGTKKCKKPVGTKFKRCK